MSGSVQPQCVCRSAHFFTQTRASKKGSSEVCASPRARMLCIGTLTNGGRITQRSATSSSYIPRDSETRNVKHSRCVPYPTHISNFPTSKKLTSSLLQLCRLPIACAMERLLVRGEDFSCKEAGVNVLVLSESLDVGGEAAKSFALQESRHAANQLADYLNDVPVGRTVRDTVAFVFVWHPLFSLHFPSELDLLFEISPRCALICTPFSWSQYSSLVAPH